MSVTFSIDGYRCRCENPYECPECSKLTMNICNANAGALLEWLGYTGELWTYEPVDASDMAARCRRRLWDEARNIDCGLPVRVEGKVVDCGRRPGYLTEKTRQLLVIAEEAQRRNSGIVWG